MIDRSVVSRLLGEIASLRGRLSRLRAEGADVAAVRALIMSLRLTLACLLSGREVRKAGLEGFTAQRAPESDPLVKHRGRTLPVSGLYLAHLMKDAGVGLLPYEFILLDPSLVRLLLEEALARVGFQEAVIRQEKATLNAAYLAADAPGSDTSLPAAPLPQEAA